MRIRQDYFDMIEQSLKMSIDNFSIESLWIEKEFGIFNGFTVVRFNRLLDHFPGGGYPGTGTPGTPMPSRLAGVCFNYFAAWGIVLWRDEEITNIYGAFNRNILSEADVQKIASMDNSVVMDHSICYPEREEE
jgi:hypothetical protein